MATSERNNIPPWLLAGAGGCLLLVGIFCGVGGTLVGVYTWRSPGVDAAPSATAFDQKTLSADLWGADAAKVRAYLGRPDRVDIDAVPAPGTEHNAGWTYKKTRRNPTTGKQEEVEIRIIFEQGRVTSVFAPNK
jgi:hypothetical protein